MKKWLLRSSVVLCTLVVLVVGTWWCWREWYSAGQLNAAFREQDFEEVKFLLNLGAQIPEKERVSGIRRIHYWAVIGETDKVRVLLEAGEDVNARKSQEVLTPLHLAAATGRFETVDYLISIGANVNASRVKIKYDSLTPLDCIGELGTTKWTSKQDLDRCRELLRAAGGKTYKELQAEKAQTANPDLPQSPAPPGQPAEGEKE